MAKPWEISIDTGGTFTDCIGTDPQGNTFKIKVLSHSALRGVLQNVNGQKKLVLASKLSRPQDIFKGYSLRWASIPDKTFTISATHLGQDLIETHESLPEFPDGSQFEIVSPEEVPVFICRLVTGTPLNQKLPPIRLRVGSTKGTNAILEKKGGEVVFLVTEGHQDLLHIGNQQRPDIFALEVKKPKPLFTQVIPVKERLNVNGAALTPLDNDEILRIIKEIKAIGPDAIAIALMHSTINPAHELTLEKALTDSGIKNITLSHKMSAQMGWISRATTTVANAYLQPVIERFKSKITEAVPEVIFMTSGGQLIPSAGFLPKDSLLSGPAGGVVGARMVAEKNGFSKVITLDMGGTSTDVARYDGAYEYQYETQVGDARILGQAMAIETIAAGGGSICGVDDLGRLFVGPESAGSIPGPACYGNGGPLTLTDINLLLGRIDPEKMGIPISREAPSRLLTQIKKSIKSSTGLTPSREEILGSYIRIADESMAEAIRKISINKGEDPAEYALLAFGGAGGLHACGVAELLNIKTIIAPADAGILSAVGIREAEIATTVERQILEPLTEAAGPLDAIISDLVKEGETQLIHLGCAKERLYTKPPRLFLRLTGQATALSIPYEDNTRISTEFRKAYEKIYGHWLKGKAIELESIRIEIVERKILEVKAQEKSLKATFSGPLLITLDTSTLYIAKNWDGRYSEQGALILNKKAAPFQEDSTDASAANLELFINRFKAVAEAMGAKLQGTAFSVNVKERLDFSCAVLDPKGQLIANAPHIPVHLGSLGLCVRAVIQKIPLGPGDVVITNHPGYGGSHLPDITLVSGVFDANKVLLGFVANRAHHAELGGKIPGSMPPDAKNLDEEGVVIAPMLLAENGAIHWQKVRQILTSGPYPTRAIEENMADLRGAYAAIMTGIKALQTIAEKYGTRETLHYMDALKEYSAKRLEIKLRGHHSHTWQATEIMDHGAAIKVAIRLSGSQLVFDFTGSGAQHPGNLNATPAIVNSVVIYILRVWLNEPVPLNEGLMMPVKLILPEGFLNPDFSKNPAVMGGNTEISQRLTGAIIKALGWGAGSQGTMNNLVFGNDHFSCYETIGGGTGAGPDFHGADGVHHHMTNTRITDPEIMEWRYPVILEQFEIRKSSLGDGQYRGGNGLVRKIKMLQPTQVALLTQHRNTGPYGLNGGTSGKPGNQYILTQNGPTIQLRYADARTLNPGDTLVIETPGGGGWGSPVGQERL